MSRLLILASKLGYQTRSFAEAARALGVEVVFASDRCHQLEDPWSDGAIALHFDQPEEAARRIVAQSLVRPVDGLIGLGDRPTTTAAYAAGALGLVYNRPQAVENCRSKLRQREILRDAGLPVPGFFSFRLDKRLERILPRVQFPCVVKPLRLAASQGVVRANNPEEFQAAVARIRALLESPEIQVTNEEELDRLIVERYFPGAEVAVEGLLARGKLRILAIFDKPDPLVGPYFEETIYVTPSRLEPSIQAEVARELLRAVDALGLFHGPLHAELRVKGNCNWILEIAARPIGGLCARSLRFGNGISLEELIIRHALDEPVTHLGREEASSGVMMMPIPQEGIYKGVEQLEQAAQVPGIEAIEITAKLRQKLVPLPEGSSYLGFIFSRGDSPQYVEGALREAHRRLRFIISSSLPVV